MAEAESADVTGMPLRPGVKVHVYQHCVANKPPNPGRYRMLYETAPGQAAPVSARRPHVIRAARPPRTSRHGMQSPYNTANLIDWYLDEYSGINGQTDDPVLALRGLGKEVWASEDADAYVRRQRTDWQ